MQAECEPTRSEHDAREPDVTLAAHRMAERILDDIERIGRRARADRLAEILLSMTETEAGAIEPRGDRT